MRDAENLVNSLLGEAIDIPGYGDQGEFEEYVDSELVLVRVSQGGNGIPDPYDTVCDGQSGTVYTLVKARGGIETHPNGPNTQDYYATVLGHVFDLTDGEYDSIDHGVRVTVIDD